MFAYLVRAGSQNTRVLGKDGRFKSTWPPNNRVALGKLINLSEILFPN